ncbi:MAG: hypothetical protein RL204_133 [Bacteroidota bacterium]|jgi:hypothetical protein
MKFVKARYDLKVATSLIVFACLFSFVRCTNAPVNIATIKVSSLQELENIQDVDSIGLLVINLDSSFSLNETADILNEIAITNLEIGGREVVCQKSIKINGLRTLRVTGPDEIDLSGFQSNGELEYVFLCSNCFKGLGFIVDSEVKDIGLHSLNDSIPAALKGMNGVRRLTLIGSGICSSKELIENLPRNLSSLNIQSACDNNILSETELQSISQVLGISIDQIER